MMNMREDAECVHSLGYWGTHLEALGYGAQGGFVLVSVGIP